MTNLPTAVTEPRSRAVGRLVEGSIFLTALLLGAVLLSLQPDVDTASDGLIFADLVIGVVLCVSLWWRLRWPVQLAILAAILTSFSAFAGAAGCILLFTVAANRRASVALWIAGLHLVAGVVFVWLRPDPTMAFWAQALLVVPIVAAVVAWGMYVQTRRQLLESLQERAVRAESEQQLRIEQARHLERARIAREMHDVLAHRISLVSLHAGALEFRTDATSEEVTRSAGVIRSSAHQALQDLREILGLLRSDGDRETSLAPQPTLADVARLVEESRRAGMRIRLECTVEDLATVPASIGRTGYRVIQEGLTNARKHAPGVDTTVRVSGAVGPGLEVEVCSRRPAETPALVPVAAGAAIPGAGQGLTGLSERTAIAGGRLEHGRTATGDFRLAAWLPWTA